MFTVPLTFIVEIYRTINIVPNKNDDDEKTLNKLYFVVSEINHNNLLAPK